MAIWNTENSLLTQKGEEILNKIKIGEGKITISKIVAGSGRVSDSSLYKQTQISGTHKPFVINGCKTIDGGSEISFYLSNDDFTEPFTLNQIGIYVTHPDYEGEVLYHISQCDEVGADLVPAYTGNAVTLTYSLFLAHGNSSSIILNIDPLGMVTAEQFESFKQEYNSTVQSVNTSIKSINSAVSSLTTDYNAFKSGVGSGMLITADSSGNLITSGKSTVKGHPVIVTDAISHRALSLSIEGKSTQVTTPTPSTPVYHVDSKIEDIRNYNGSNAKYISFPSVITLRSLGEYKDTIEWDGAKWWKVQRIQEVIMDGITNKVYSSNGNSSATYCRYALTTGSYKLIQDHIASAPVETSHGNATYPNDTAELYAFHYTSSNVICCHFLNTLTGVTSTQTATEKGNTINEWLKAQNTAGTPLKVRYVLKTPIVTEISLTEVLEMYANHTEMSCSVEGNVPNMVLSYALKTTDSTTMYILRSLARKSDVQTANTFAVATLIE